MQITQYGKIDLNVQFKIYAQDAGNVNSEQLNHFMFKYLTQFHFLSNNNVSDFEYKVLSTLLDEVGRKYKYLFDKNNKLNEYFEKQNTNYIHIEVDINLSNIEVKKYSYNADVSLVDDKITNIGKISLYSSNERNDKISSIYTVTDLNVKLKNILSTNLDDTFYIYDINIENKSSFDDEESLINIKRNQLLGEIL